MNYLVALGELLPIRQFVAACGIAPMVRKNHVANVLAASGYRNKMLPRIAVVVATAELPYRRNQHGQAAMETSPALRKVKPIYQFHAARRSERR